MLDEIYVLSERASSDENVDGLRIDIANLTARLLDSKRETLTDWDKWCFVSALSALKMPTDDGPIGYTSWLQLCLTGLSNLFVPKDEISDHVVIHPNITKLTFNQILGEIRRLGRHQ